MRREKKYTFQHECLPDIRKRLHDSRFLMKKTYADRYVNSIYLDSFDYQNYNENLSGLSQRSKARLRWYSHSPFTNISASQEIFFEIKLRNNFLGEKLVHKIIPSKDMNLMNSSELMLLLRSMLPVEFLPYIDHCNTFSLGVSYKREYFEDFTREIRATIDKKLKYIRLSSMMPLDFREIETIKVDYGVLELKYPDTISDKMINMNLDLSEITAGRHSKYATGINILER